MQALKCSDRANVKYSWKTRSLTSHNGVRFSFLLCEILHVHIVYQFMKNTFQWAIQGIWGCHHLRYIISSKDSEKSLHAWVQGLKHTVNAHDLRPLRQHCIKSNIILWCTFATWAWGTLWKSIVSLHSKLTLVHEKPKSYINNIHMLRAQAHLRWTGLKLKSMILGCVSAHGLMG